MKQFGKILAFELKYYFKNKIFVGVTLLLVLIIAAVMSFPRISALFKSDGGSDAFAEPSVMLVSADNPARAEALKQAFSAAFDGYEVIFTEASREALKEKIIAGDAECAFVITGDTAYTYYVNNLSLYDVNTEIADEVLRQSYQLSALLAGGMRGSPPQNTRTRGRGREKAYFACGAALRRAGKKSGRLRLFPRNYQG